jgi:DNA replication protein DnaC
MDDDLKQLLESLKMGRERTEEHLRRALDQKPAYSDFLRGLLREELHAQQERLLEGRLERARMPERWSLESFPWERQPGVSKAQLLEFGKLGFLADGTNLVFIGSTGVGKTGLATGLLLKALLSGRRGLFVKAQDLFDEMYQSLADRSTRRLLTRMGRLDLLLIDEMGYLNLRPEQSNIFFKLMEERYQNKVSTVITTNLEYEEWAGFLGQKGMVKALLDRLQHRCQTIRLEGPSLRTAM